MSTSGLLHLLIQALISQVPCISRQTKFFSYSYRYYSLIDTFKAVRVKILIWTNRILLTSFLLLSLLGVLGKLAFGHGIGDLLYYILMWLTSLAFVILFIYKKKLSLPLLISITTLFVFILLYLIYSMTFGRGPEYRWNGSILYY